MERARSSRGGGIDHGNQDVEDLRALIEANLRAFERETSTSVQTRAAVAVTVLLDEEGEASVPIFQRPARMRRHAGQMALPGGRVQAGETVEAAALRELDEELGLAVSPDHVLGLLDDFDTVSGFTITPVVVWSGARASELRPSEDEVAIPFIVPVSILRQAAAAAGAGPAFSLRLPLVEVFAPTAAILYQFSEVALDGRSVRVRDFFQPPWTHR
jgi:8-oxo-dGTP pyrophosphatase MutT (NUDIX family)